MSSCKIAFAFPTGPCFGVDRALKITEDVLLRNKNVYMLHPLIHNPRVVEDMKKRGVVITDPDKIPPGGTVILSAHGTPVEVREILERKKAYIIDAVCPLVEHLHARAKELIDEGRFLIIVADERHQETKALISHLPHDSYTLYPHLEKVPQRKALGVIFQTTFEYARVPDVIKDIYMLSDDIRIINTICPATRGRQGVLDRVGNRYDFIIVVGGKISANTRRLYEKALQYADAVWIERPEELDINEVCKHESVLIIGGASTPIEQLVEVYLHLKKVIQ